MRWDKINYPIHSPPAGQEKTSNQDIIPLRIKSAGFLESVKKTNKQREE